MKPWLELSCEYSAWQTVVRSCSNVLTVIVLFLFVCSIGFIIGVVLCATLFSIVSSAVNTVIVCYAEAPQEFQNNHPELSEKMRAAWRQAWPNEFRY